MILITRPFPEAKQTSDVLQRKGFLTHIDPMLTIQPVKAGELQKSNVVVFTSANGVRYAPDKLLEWQPFVYTVGDHTAQEAKNRGFSQVVSAQGDVKKLADTIKSSLSSNLSVLHICGKYSDRQALDELGNVGIRIKHLVVYEAIASPKLSDDTCDKLNNKLITSALFFSPRTAKIFETNLNKLSMQNGAEIITAYCISKAVAKELNPARWERIRAAAEPTLDSVLSML